MVLHNILLLASALVDLFAMLRISNVDQHLLLHLFVLQPRNSVATKGHHKAADTLKGRNFLIRLFYGCYPFFGYCCVFTEFFYICMYLLAFNPKAELTITDGVTVSLWQITYIVCMPACICKQAVNVAQLCAAAYSMAESDVAVKTA
jgi:CDP-diacylglycerol--inositol 3-phosphatidyltransferase